MVHYPTGGGEDMVKDIFIAIALVFAAIAFLLISLKFRERESERKRIVSTFFSVAGLSFGEKNVTRLSDSSVLIIYFGQTFLVDYDPYGKIFHLRHENDTFSTHDGNKVISFIESEISF